MGAVAREHAYTHLALIVITWHQQLAIIAQQPALMGDGAPVVGRVQAANAQRIHARP